MNRLTPERTAESQFGAPYRDRHDWAARAHRKPHCATATFLQAGGITAMPFGEDHQYRAAAQRIFCSLHRGHVALAALDRYHLHLPEPPGHQRIEKHFDLGDPPGPVRKRERGAEDVDIGPVDMVDRENHTLAARRQVFDPLDVPV